MNDAEFLMWIYKRLIIVHKEDELYDYMHKLKDIIKQLEAQTQSIKTKGKFIKIKQNIIAIDKIKAIHLGEEKPLDLCILLTENIELIVTCNSVEDLETTFNLFWDSL